MRVVIVGGGIAGMSAAAALAPHAEVTLLERETGFGYHASGRSAAMFVEDYGNAAVRALNRASKAEHERLGVLSPRGVMMVALEEDVPAFEADLADLGMDNDFSIFISDWIIIHGLEIWKGFFICPVFCRIQ